MTETVIKIEDLSLRYENERTSFEALKGIELDIDRGEFVCLIGPSGCGKSTLLGVLEGLLEPSSGRVLINGKEVHGAGPERAVVFQNYSLFPWMSAQRNVSFAVIESKKAVEKISKKDAKERAAYYLKKVGLSGYEDKLPGELSGGMQQRVAVVRGVINRPEVLFADEPTGALNSQNTINVLDILSDLNNEGQSIVMVTHTVSAAERGHRIIYLADGIISDECDLGPYVGGYKDDTNPYKDQAVERHRKLKEFLQKQGW